MINDELNPAPSETSEVTDITAPETIQPQSPILVFIAKLLLAAWMLCYITFALAILINSWAHNNQGICDYLMVRNCDGLSPIFISVIHAMLGAVLGAGVLGLISFHRHVSMEQNFDLAHIWGYIFAPWLSAVLGLAVFVLLQSGLLILSGELGTSNEVSIQNLAYLGIGFLSGFGWYDATRRIQKIVRNFFSEKDSQADEPNPQAEQPAAGETAPASESEEE